jgi:hypothetical protein
MKGFSVTHEQFLPHDPEGDICEANYRGFVVEDGTLREALDEFDSRGMSVEPSAWPVDYEYPWLSFSANDVNDGTREFYEQGISESRTLHLPATLTSASRRRVARLLGIRGA